MPYTKFNDPWVDAPTTTTPVTGAALDHLEQGIYDAYALAEAGGGGGGGSSGTPAIVVAAATAPAGIQAIADYQCDGTADQTEINLAITSAFTSSGGAAGRVILAGKFYISGSILMRHGIMVTGTSPGGTIVTSVGMGAVGMFQLFDVHTGLTNLRDLTILGNSSSGGSSHGIAYRNSTGALGAAAGTDGNIGTYTPGNSPDSSHRIDNVILNGFQTNTRHGIWLDDNCRDSNIMRARIFNCSGNGLNITGASDGKFAQVITSACNVGIADGGGSNQFVECKSAYAVTDGWQVSSSRAHLTG